MMGIRINRSEKERPDRFAPNGIGGSTGGAPALGPRDQISDSEIDQRGKLKVLRGHPSSFKTAYNLALQPEMSRCARRSSESFMSLPILDGYRGGDGKSAVVRNN